MKKLDKRTGDPINRPTPLYKTTIAIWSEEDPREKYELVDLAREATDGTMYCSLMDTERVEDPERDPDWDGTEFFWDQEE